MNSNVGSKAAILQKLNDGDMLRYYSTNYPSFVVFHERNGRDIDNLNLPTKFLEDCDEQLPRNIILQLANGHETHVHFKRSEQRLCHMSSFVKDCLGIFGSVMVYSYKGNGRFLVSCLRDDLGEVIYFLHRTIPRGTVYDQDLITGIGWKFLVLVNNPDSEYGEIPVPASFWRSYGKFLPETVNFYLRNGKMYRGSCSRSERRMTDLSEIVAENRLNGNDKLLFTYFGAGDFLILIFDNSNVEKLLNPESDDESDSDSESDDSDVEIIHDNAIDEGHDNVFTSIMSASNVNSSSHGAYIPNRITPTARDWEAGDRVTFRTANGEWDIGIVMSNRSARFSGGWNQFARVNNLMLNERLVFTLIEDDDHIIFDIQFPDRIDV